MAVNCGSPCPATAQNAMRGSASSIVSIHSGLTFLPNDVTSRLSLRPCTVTKPSRSMAPRSPVRQGPCAGSCPRYPSVIEGPSTTISPLSTDTESPFNGRPTVPERRSPGRLTVTTEQHSERHISPEQRWNENRTDRLQQQRQRKDGEI